MDIPEQDGRAMAHDAATFRALDRGREEKSAEEIARYIEERYQKMEEGGYGYEDAAALHQTGAVGQQALLPTVNDPKLWILNCRPGHEREAAVQLLQKHYTMKRAGNPLLIKSVVALDHLKVCASNPRFTPASMQRLQAWLWTAGYVPLTSSTVH